MAVRTAAQSFWRLRERLAGEAAATAARVVRTRLKETMMVVVNGWS
jgi:hypothetical protein